MKKICTKCGESKGLELFAKSKRNKSGFQAFCLSCAAASTRAYRQNNLAKIRKNENDYRVSNIETVRERDRKRGSVNRSLPEYKIWRSQWLALHLLWLNSIKNVPCVACGRRYLPCAMDFDHVRAKKKKPVSLMLGMRRDLVLAEISKCDLVCTNCHRIRTVARMRQRQKQKKARPSREAYYIKINELKNNPCLDCGESFPPEAMDFDHVRGEKEVSLSHMKDMAWSKVEAELTKCELVCACCHRIRTWQRKQVKEAA